MQENGCLEFSKLVEKGKILLYQNASRLVSRIKKDGFSLYHRHDYLINSDVVYIDFI